MHCSITRRTKISLSKIRSSKLALIGRARCPRWAMWRKLEARWRMPATRPPTCHWGPAARSTPGTLAARTAGVACPGLTALQRRPTPTAQSTPGGLGARTEAPLTACRVLTALQRRPTPTARSTPEGLGARVACPGLMALPPRAVPTARSTPEGLGARAEAAQVVWLDSVAPQPRAVPAARFLLRLAWLRGGRWMNRRELTRPRTPREMATAPLSAG